MKLYQSKDQCCGCCSCVDVCPKNAITFEMDDKGFYYPKVDKKLCVSCGLCTSVCAFKTGKNDEKVYVQKALAVKHKEKQVHMSSSSGGVFSALSDEVINKGGVVFGAAFVSKDKIAHIRCESLPDRDRTKGSKYAQSDMQGVYNSIKKDLNDGKTVLFSGTPCQVAAVAKRFKDNRDQLILVDVICHGVPSPGIFAKHISFCEKLKGKKVKQYLFRGVGNGGRNNVQTIIYEDGEVDYDSKYIKIYFNLFNENKILRKSCFECPYACSDRKGDITIGDFWGIEKIAPDFADKNGVSAVLINTQRGEELFNTVSDKLDCIECTFDDIAKRNPNLKHPSSRPKFNKFQLMYKMFGYNGAVKGYYKNNFLTKIKHKIAKILK